MAGTRFLKRLNGCLRYNDKMSFERVILQRLRGLPREKQREVLDFVEFLAQKTETPSRYLGMQGLWEDFHLEITGADINEVRKEMWEPSLNGEQA